MSYWCQGTPVDGRNRSKALEKLIRNGSRIQISQTPSLALSIVKSSITLKLMNKKIKNMDRDQNGL